MHGEAIKHLQHCECLRSVGSGILEELNVCKLAFLNIHVPNLIMSEKATVMEAWWIKETVEKSLYHSNGEPLEESTHCLCIL